METTEEKKQPPVQIKKFEESTLQMVLTKVNQFREVGELKIPKDYAPENALRSAWLTLQETKTKDGQPVLQECSKESIANALLKMVTEGLSPLKRQGSFIAYGKKLQWQREYGGTLALAKRYGEMKEIHAQIIYDGDVFEYAIDKINGRKSVIKHEQKFENINNAKIKGAYAIVVFNDGTTDLEIMPLSEIHNAWNQGPMKGASPAHKNFPDQMCKKTVISRACKLLISGSDDAVLMEDSDDDKLVKRVKQEITAQGNGEEINMDEIQTAEEVKNPEPDTETTPQEAPKEEPEQQKKQGRPRIEKEPPTDKMEF
jgi:recombination protein RecT